MEAVQEAGIFAYLVEDETYHVASEIHDLLVKTYAADTAKIEVIRSIVAEHFDVDALMDRIDALGSTQRQVTVPEVQVPTAGEPAAVVPAAEADQGLLPRSVSRWLRSLSGR